MSRPYFQHRQFADIAHVFACHKARNGPSITRTELVLDVVKLFQLDNENFNEGRFLAACDGKPLLKKDFRK